MRQPAEDISLTFGQHKRTREQGGQAQGRQQRDRLFGGEEEETNDGPTHKRYINNTRGWVHTPHALVPVTTAPELIYTSYKNLREEHQHSF